MATINPSQDYDIIHTLTYASSGGENTIRLSRGSFSSTTGTVYYRAGTSGAWTSLSVSGASTTFPIMSTTMQIAHNWNKSGNDYMTPIFNGGTMTGIAISQKAALNGVMGNYFMANYASSCSSLTTLAVLDTSGLTSVGDWFMSQYAVNCSSLTTLAVPDTSGLTSVGNSFMYYYALNCTNLTQLNLPKAGWFKANNVNWYVPSGRLGLLHGDTTDLQDYLDWKDLIVSGKTLYTNYIRSTSNLLLNGEPQNASPTTTLNSPANNVSLTTTTPTLAFTATDPDGDQVSYQIQVSTSSSFTSTHMDVTTATFASGTQQTRVVSPALTQGGIDYYWRVRAKDPSGSDSYGAWATARKMTTEALPPSVTSGATTSITTTQATVAGNVSSVNGANLTERGFVYSTSTNPTTANSKQVVSGTTGSFSGNLTGLTPNTTYYWRAYATNSKGTTYGVNRSFTTEPRPPVVSTGTASGTAINSFTVSGSGVTSNPDSQTINEYGIVYSTSQNPTIANSKQTGTGTSASFNATLTGLSENTTYYARAYAKWRGTDHVYGSQVSFKTQGRPVITLNTPAASGSVTELRPNLEFTGVDPDSNTITYQLQVNTTNTFTSPALDLLSASDPGFSNRSDVKTDPFYSGNQIRYTPQTDLNRGQDYYWRVRGRDTNGSDTWGNWTTSRKFTVEPIPATVSITGLGTIESDSIAINANITDDGGATVTERGIVWSLSPNPTTSDNKATATGNPFTATATGLTATTEYNFRAYAINSKGTSYSANITQMTLQTEGPPTLTTGEATGIYYTNANVSGEVTLDGRHPVTERGVVFSETANPTTADRKFTAPTAGLGEFSGAITGLDPDTVYYMRAYAINAMGTGYGTQKTFTTLALPEDEDDGYWVFSNSDSTAVVARTQSTPANSSANVFVEPFMERGETYTLHVGDIEADHGAPSLVLEYIEGTLQTIPIAPNTNHTFTYTETMSLVRLRMYVTDATAVAEELSATFHDLYLAKESSFSGFVNFERRGAKEIKIINNQILDKRREDTLPTIYPKLLGLRYTPFDIKTEGLGYFEVYDSFKIEDPNGDVKTVLLTDKTLTIDGGISETLQGKAPDKTDTDYSKAGGITKLISQTTLEVDKQRGEIEALVSDVYDNDGYIEEKFSQVFQDISEVRTTVQGAGGVNQIRNSVMYAYNNLGYPESWTTTHVDGEGSTIVIQGSAESRAAGGLSGNTFTLNGTKVVQNITVRKDVDFIPEDQKTHYTFSIKVKKNLVGEAYIKLSNRQEEHIIDLPNGEAYLWEDFTINALLPQDDYYDLEIYSDQDAAAQFTDTMLSVGESPHAWTLAPGEVGNASVSITETGVTVRQDQFRYNYTHMDALGFNVHKRIRGQQAEVFGFNADETHMAKVKADKQITMGSMRVVPINMNGTEGWAWTGTVED